MQAVIKQAAAKAGIEIELKTVTPSSFYSSDPANPAAYTHFYADLQLMVYVMGPPDPERLMRVFTSWEIASKANNWQKFNVELGIEAQGLTHTPRSCIGAASRATPPTLAAVSTSVLRGRSLPTASALLATAS